MTTTTDERALLAAVCEYPHDDTPRLVFADWLDEHAGTAECRGCGGSGRLDADHRPGTIECRVCQPWGSGTVPDGRAARAEFIRVQCEMAGNTGISETRFDALRRRERELREANAPKWFPLPGLNSCSVWDEGSVRWFPDGTSLEVLQGWCRRGFVEEIRCTAADWLAVADALAWSPGATDECPGCDGTRYRDRVSKPCYVCRTDDGASTGRVPRPCPPTAQPITRVVLTALPPGNPTWHDMLSQFGHKWPWIKFARVNQPT